MLFPLRKLRRQVKCVLLGGALLLGALAMYYEVVASRAWSGQSSDSGGWKTVLSEERVGRAVQLDRTLESALWDATYTPPTWKPEFKGRVNLHVFEDWCGGSTADLQRNLHYPLYPHSRTTVSKLAVSPQWNNYGLRIFGFLHPYADGDYVFAVSSDDNADLWLSADASPLNVQLVAWVGTTGAEWSAPGEFEKYASQTSRPVRLSGQKKYFFEVVHKQNDRGNDHVEVAWQLLNKDVRFNVIESEHLSLYADESAVSMGDVAHIPQTTASHHNAHKHHQRRPFNAAADMLRDDPRDEFHRVPPINSRFLEGLLPDCSYDPTYRIKGLPLARYQGLQFVHMSYVYPNDFTRLTHMETESSCYYPENPSYMKIFGFSRYMRFDRWAARQNAGRDYVFQRRESFKRKLFSFDLQESANKEDNSSSTKLRREALDPRREEDNEPDPEKPGKLVKSMPTQPLHPQSKQDGLHQDEHSEEAEQIEPQEDIKAAKRPKSESATKSGLKSALLPEKDDEPDAQRQAADSSEPLRLIPTQRSTQSNQSQNHQHKEPQHQRRIPSLSETTHRRGVEAKDNDSPVEVKDNDSPVEAKDNDSPVEAKDNDSPVEAKDNDSPVEAKDNDSPVEAKDNDSPVEAEDNDSQPAEAQHVTVKLKLDPRVGERLKEDEGERKLQRGDVQEPDGHSRGKIFREWSDPAGSKLGGGEVPTRRERKKDSGWAADGENSEGLDDLSSAPPAVYDPLVSWNQTFQVKHFNIQATRSDWIDLSCNVSGNLLLSHSEVLPIVEAFVDQLNAKHHGRFTLTRVVNVVKRVDGYKGSRYLLELELKDSDGQVVRVTRYVYALIKQSSHVSRELSLQRAKPHIVLCNPVGFQWNPAATVHFIVPVKNQARWVQQLIADMERLFRQTGDTNFNLIITDYNSTDMDVRSALQRSSLYRYQYVKLSGNFERSAGLQAGINLIDDEHSIVFLCDLHIHFPPSIIHSIRKHCVEGHMAFAPIVLRLNCGATPLEAKGFWEVNGFGLLGIFKSDLMAAGGMNTKEFKERWGGEDWELLDRLLQAGLEVDRIYLKNFFHYYHSKRGMWNRRMSTTAERR